MIFIKKKAAAGGGPVDWPENWVSNANVSTGNGWLHWDGAAAGVDGVHFGAFFSLRKLDELSGINTLFDGFSQSPRLRFLGTTRQLHVRLENDSGTVLVDWTSSGELGPDRHLIHIKADLTDIGGGVGTFAVNHVARDDMSPAWAALPGSFTTGPVAGTINNLRTGAGNDDALLSQTGGANDFVGEFSILAVSLDGGTAFPAKELFWDEVLFSPLTAGSFTYLYTGPVSTLSANQGTGPDMTVTGDFTNV